MELTNRIATKARQARLSLNAPAARESVEDFEAQSGIRLPDDYRYFLLTVADGGQPPCRLVPLSRWGDCYWLDEPRPAMAAENCLLSPALEERGAGWLETLNVLDWKSRWDHNEWCPVFGTVAIAEIGCGLFYSMIVTGAHRGRIFSWGDHASNPPCFVPQLSFGAWLEFHLDQMLAGKPVHFLDGRLR